MPRKEEGRWVDGKYVTTSVGADTDYAPPSEVSTADLGAVARKTGNGQLATTYTPSKKRPGEGLGEFAARSKKEREDYEKAEGQKKALKK